MKFVTAVVVAMSISTPASAHHEQAKMHYWMHRCGTYSQKAVLACIHRATTQYHQSYAEARYIAHRESRFNWRVTNSSSGAAGLFQFMPRTWNYTPYRHHSPYNPKWASLAAMWMWKHGWKSAWAA